MVGEGVEQKSCCLFANDRRKTREGNVEGGVLCWASPRLVEVRFEEVILEAFPERQDVMAASWFKREGDPKTGCCSRKGLLQC